MKNYYKLILWLGIAIFSFHTGLSQEKTEKDYFAQMVKAEKYLIGNGYEKDESQAFKLIKDCAENSINPNSKYWLAKLYFEGTGIEKSKEEGIKWFKKAADQGSLKAMMKLGIIYKDGDDVAQDFTKSYSYFLKAAELNFTPAMYGVGYMKYKGLGTKQDYSAAIQWFTKGAGRNSASCNFMLGTAYMHGNGVSRDLKKAKEYYTSSAEKGHSIAKNKMDKLDERLARIEKESKCNLDFNTIDYTPDNINLQGKWEGKAYYLDYSRTKKITESKVILVLETINGSVIGKWFEDNKFITEINGKIEGNRLVLNATGYNLGEKDDEVFVSRFESCTFKFMSGSELHAQVETYYPTAKEPGKSIYLVLDDTKPKKDNPDEAEIKSAEVSLSDSLAKSNGNILGRNPANTATRTISNRIHEESPNDAPINSSLIPDFNYMVYPNPFKNDLNVSFNVKLETQVYISIYSISGELMDKIDMGLLNPGNYTSSVGDKLHAGSYLVVLSLDGIRQGKVVIKN